MVEKKKQQQQQQPQQQPEEDSTTKSCDICCESFRMGASGRCDHLICIQCMLRMRSLYKEKACCVCRTELEDVVCGQLPMPPFDQAISKVLGLKGTSIDERVRFLNPASLEYAESLFRPRCGKCPATAGPFATMDLLRSHAKSEHGLQYCPLCLAHKKVFPMEQALYTPEALKAHLGPSRREHAWCRFCHYAYYDEAALVEHSRHKHEVCTICVKRSFPECEFQDFAHLRQHYRTVHFYCDDAECGAHTVFETEIEYRNHQIDVHMRDKKLSRSELRNARRLDVEVRVNYEALPSSSSGHRRGDGGRGRGASHGARGDRGGGGRRRGTAQQYSSTLIVAPKVEEPEPLSAGTVDSAVSKQAERERAGNAELVGQLRQFLGDAKYNEFKALSLNFKTGAITVRQYYEAIGKFFGAYAQVFFERLVGLLPDPVLRENLRKVHQSLHGELWVAQKSESELQRLLRGRAAAEAPGSSAFPVLGNSVYAPARSEAPAALYEEVVAAPPGLGRSPAEDFPALPTSQSLSNGRSWGAKMPVASAQDPDHFPSLPIGQRKLSAKQKRKAAAQK